MNEASKEELPEVLELFAVIADLYTDANGFDGVVVRNVGAKYASKPQFYSGAGAAKTGGRWNGIGLAAVYASLDVETATAEAFQDFLYRGFSLKSMKPRVTAAARVRVSKLFDLTDLGTLALIGFTRKMLVQEDWRSLQHSGVESWTQAIGRGAHRARFEALLVPSARKQRGKNIVIFLENFSQTSQLEIIGADQLPS